MPRANRYFITGHVWHITHRCHQRQFLFKFAKDRARWRYWLFEAKKRFGLSVLNFIVTSNHIHLLVRDTGDNVIAKSMQLIAGRVAQEYNITLLDMQRLVSLFGVLPMGRRSGLVGIFLMMCRRQH